MGGSGIWDRLRMDHIISPYCKEESDGDSVRFYREELERFEREILESLMIPEHIIEKVREKDKQRMGEI